MFRNLWMRLESLDSYGPGTAGSEMARRRAPNGMTLIEIMVVIVIIGVLAVTFGEIMLGGWLARRPKTTAASA